MRINTLRLAKIIANQKLIGKEVYVISGKDTYIAKVDEVIDEDTILVSENGIKHQVDLYNVRQSIV